MQQKYITYHILRLGKIEQFAFCNYRPVYMQAADFRYTQGDSDVILMPAGFLRHLVGKTLRTVFHCDIAEIRFVGKLVIIQTFS